MLLRILAIVVIISFVSTLTDARDSSFVNSCGTNFCENGGNCTMKYVNGEYKLNCACPSCYSGRLCEKKVCYDKKSTYYWYFAAVRTSLLALTGLIGLGAFCMFLRRIHIISIERRVNHPIVQNISNASSHKIRYRGKKRIVLRQPATTSSSYCSTIHSAIFGVPKNVSIANEQIESLPPRETTAEFEARLAKFREKHLKEMQTFKKRTFPPWDEVEMRRHGLVNRHCDRVYAPDCPSNPSTVDVSVYNDPSTFVVTQAGLYSSDGTRSTSTCGTATPSSSLHLDNTAASTTLNTAISAPSMHTAVVPTAQKTAPTQPSSKSPVPQTGSGTPLQSVYMDSNLYAGAGGALGGYHHR
uniref:EGF-like domain-containing protein n=1 Tax=Panagrellus redivivus TaxID=6233 RepID=A0A7E4UX17_PANRE